jgi:hypothetical protein
MENSGTDFPQLGITAVCSSQPNSRKKELTNKLSNLEVVRQSG